jgi:hypothetical protein
LVVGERLNAEAGKNIAFRRDNIVLHVVPILVNGVRATVHLFASARVDAVVLVH